MRRSVSSRRSPAGGGGRTRDRTWLAGKVRARAGLTACTLAVTVSVLLPTAVRADVCIQHHAEAGLNGPTVHVRNVCRHDLDVNVCLRFRGDPVFGDHRNSTRLPAGGSSPFGLFDPDGREFRYRVEWCAPNATTRTDRCRPACPVWPGSEADAPAPGVDRHYEGDLVDGRPHGRGVYRWPSGARYEGEWRDGKRHGRGVYTWADGGRYDGEYVDGARTGRGVQTWAGGTRAISSTATSTAEASTRL